MCHTLHVPADALPALLFALERTRDALEARAIIATCHDPDLGVVSAAEYREDSNHLAGLLAGLDASVELPDPGREAVVWIDGTYAIVDGTPVRLRPESDCRRLIDRLVDAARDHPALTVRELLTRLTADPEATEGS